MAKTVPLEVRVIYNAAALRAALEKVHNNIKKAREFIAWQSREDELLMEAQQEIKTALSAPARNCDARDAHDAWRDFLADKRFADCSASFQAGANAAIRWLYAPAQEGGAE